MNRNMFRGVIAALLSGGLVFAGAVTGVSIASGASDNPAESSTGGMLYERTPAYNEKLVPQHPVRPPRRHHARHQVRHQRRVAARSHFRRSLSGSPQVVAHALLRRRGWSETQWNCLDQLWTRESNWQVHAENSSGAYGIPQALPAAKMAMMGSDWRTNAVTQIRWGLYYIAATYGTPCGALAHSNSYNYY